MNLHNIEIFLNCRKDKSELFSTAKTDKGKRKSIVDNQLNINEHFQGDIKNLIKHTQRTIME